MSQLHGANSCLRCLRNHKTFTTTATGDDRDIVVSSEAKTLCILISPLAD